MRDPLAGGDAGDTPLDPDEAAGLRLSWVATHADLDAAEQMSITTGLRRRRWRRPSTADLLDDLAVRDLHHDLFAEVWTWAGQYRATERSIGIDPRQIGVAVRALVGDAYAWLEHEDTDLAAARLHHRLVAIHPFANGNGRHGRAYTDLVLQSLGRDPFSWGARGGGPVDLARARYLDALRSADRGDLDPLVAFART